MLQSDLLKRSDCDDNLNMYLTLTLNGKRENVGNPGRDMLFYIITRSLDLLCRRNDLLTRRSDLVCRQNDLLCRQNDL